MITKKELKTYLLKGRRLASRYYLQIKIGLFFFGLLFLIFALRVIFPYLLIGGRVAGGLVSTGVSLVSQSAADLKGENGRVNFLLLGISDEEKAGAELTDTIIFLSINPQTGNTAMLSLPRDIWLASMRAKLNTAYYYGNQKKPGGGLILAKASVAEILGQPVNYGVVIDFAGFEKLIDLLGGVTVNVAKSFTDDRYPLPGKEDDDCGGDPEYGCRYESIHFEAGEQEMNGKRALKYVRSRYAEGEEGTDFARSQRQQNLLTAIKNKIFSPQVLINPLKVVQLVKVGQQSLTTDLPQKDFGGVLKLILKMRSGEIKAEILNGGAEGKEGYLINPQPNPKLYDNHWVLIPRTGDWEEIQDYLKEFLKEN